MFKRKKTDHELDDLRLKQQETKIMLDKAYNHNRKVSNRLAIAMAEISENIDKNLTKWGDEIRENHNGHR